MMTTESQTSTPIGRFAVSELGMRELNSGRQPWDLVKELIQNAWDEAPFATECRVTVEPQPEGNTTMVTVEDDGRGFSDIADAYTLMGQTDKRLDHKKRGRFSIGEKDVISVAVEAEVETKGFTVTFPRTGLREETANSRVKGTVVRVLMPWDEQQGNELTAFLQRFRPPTNCLLFVNDRQVETRPAVTIRSASLETVVQDAPGEPLRTATRTTDIHMVEPHPASDGERWLYEMGIPVQAITCRWDVDVMQRIPMSQQRDMVSERYLNRIYAEVLNQMHRRLERSDLNSEWVKQSSTHPQINPDTTKSIVTGRHGANVVFSSLDRDADARAKEAGYEVISHGELSTKEREAYRKHAAVKDSDEVFPTPPLPRRDYPPKPGTDLAKFAEWATEMASYCKLTATVLYFNEPDNERAADCSAATKTPTLRFNEGRLGKAFFQPPYGRIEHWDLLFHELGHALSNQSIAGHGEAWGNGVSKAGARIAVHITQSAGK